MRYLLTADRALDGAGQVIPDASVVIGADGRIEAVSSREGRVSEFDGTIIPLPGRTLMPGLIDGHVHLNLPADGALLEEAMEPSDGHLAAASAVAAVAALDGGVTTIRDLGGRRQTTYDARAALAQRGVLAPTTLLAGPPLTITGGHCRYFGGETDGIEGVRRSVRRRIGEGADWIKVIGSGGGTLHTKSNRASFSVDEVVAIVDEAHRFGVKVTMHCLCAEAMEQAIAARVDGIEHGWFLTTDDDGQRFSPEIAARIAEAEIRLSSTMSVGAYVVERYPDPDTLTPEEEAYVGVWHRTHAENLALFDRLRQTGVRMVGGSDAGWRHTPFHAMQKEITLMIAGGMPVLEAVSACTSDAADYLGVGDHTGGLRPGLGADVIAVDGNPLDDPAAFGSVSMVMKQGRLHRHEVGTA